MKWKNETGCARRPPKPLAFTHTLNRADSTEDDEDDEEALRSLADSSDLRRFKNTRSSDSSPEFASKSFSGDNDIIPVIALPAYTNEPRSGSIAHMRNNSTAFSAVPLYPTDVLSLNAFLVWDGHLPKYSQPSTMRIFALTTKGWKNRYIGFPMPQMVMSKMRIPASSFLRVFKSAEPDEKELERLEINEDSVIFVSEDEVGGRRSVIKIGGLDIGTGKQQSGEVAQTIWHLQITDSRELKKWILTIKNAVLGQRTGRLLHSEHEPSGEEKVISLQNIIQRRSALDALKAMSETLHAYQQKLERALDLYGGVVSPMRSLPDDLIQEIFPHLSVGRAGRIIISDPNGVSKSKQEPPPLVLERVCSRWLRLIRSTVELWTDLKYEYLPDNPNDWVPMMAFTDRLLAQSKNAPLTMAFFPQSSDFSATAKAARVLHPGIFDKLARSTERWRELCANPGSIASLQAARIIPSALPMLSKDHRLGTMLVEADGHRGRPRTSCAAITPPHPSHYLRCQHDQTRSTFLLQLRLYLSSKSQAPRRGRIFLLETVIPDIHRLLA
ncbi:hypothetical protein BKA70DRAFT_1402175 [Coprinopsis sp. MPI-PUGE-AT-0042]|nr:hypothetical protein BKA70DRAFT_1402175 [Coprinopsis sp. MPI-PUGE-AT-0042]